MMKLWKSRKHARHSSGLDLKGNLEECHRLTRVVGAQVFRCDLVRELGMRRDESMQQRQVM